MKEYEEIIYTNSMIPFLKEAIKKVHLSEGIANESILFYESKNNTTVRIYPTQARYFARVWFLFGMLYGQRKEVKNESRCCKTD